MEESHHHESIKAENKKGQDLEKENTSAEHVYVQVAIFKDGETS